MLKITQLDSNRNKRVSGKRICLFASYPSSTVNCSQGSDASSEKFNKGAHQHQR